ncbi:MAG: DUF2064 domain-containing protein [Deltaproteobacteria bacterium]|nr:DUF2064 domain-containing protein [Deltaproteobacteria bacterium]
MQYDQCLIVFAQTAQARGAVPRLAKEVGTNFCAELYKRFLSDTLATMQGGPFAVDVFYPPDMGKEAGTLSANPCRFYPQRGDGAAEKMTNAFTECFGRAFRSAVWIGADCPDLPREIVETAFGVLADGDEYDAVIGPTAGGGYYLIGFNGNAFEPDVFYGPSPTDASVLEETLDFMRNRGVRPKLISRWQHVTDRTALAKLIDRNVGTGFDVSQTMTYLKSKKISSGWQILDPRFALS